MFGSTDTSKGLLFCTDDLGQILQNTLHALCSEVESMNANRLLNTSPEDLKNYLVEKYKVTPIQLLRDQWYADAKEMPVDVRHDRNRWIDDRSQSVMVPGERIQVRVPFEGESELFFARANTFSMNPPRAILDKNELVLQYDSPADQARDVRPLIDSELTNIEEHLAWQRPMIDSHNAALYSTAAQSIEQRRARLLAQSQRAEALGIPIRRRADVPTTYAVPTVRRKAAPDLPPATTSQFMPEPAWMMDQYEQALKIVQDMTLVIERSPQAFKTMDEEALRQHFLVQLNGQFEGKATGETFNMSGKTDILLREGDRNVFIAECKFWKGPKGFAQAIDQLMGYATWRDGKLALLVFNRGTEMSTVLAGIDATVKAHGNFKRAVNWSHASGFRYIFHTSGDANREKVLTVLVFHVPT